MGHANLGAERGYNAAMAELKDRYGDPDVIALAYVERALNSPQIKRLCKRNGYIFNRSQRVPVGSSAVDCQKGLSAVFAKNDFLLFLKTF